MISTPPTRIVPLSTLSMPAIRLRRVVFPDPEGPMRAQEFPFGNVEADIPENRDRVTAPTIGLAYISDFNDGVFFTSGHHFSSDFDPGIVSRSLLEGRTHHAIPCLCTLQALRPCHPGEVLRSRGVSITRSSLNDEHMLFGPVRHESGGVHDGTGLLLFLLDGPGEKRHLGSHLRKDAGILIDKTDLDHDRWPCVRSTVGTMV